MSDDPTDCPLPCDDELVCQARTDREAFGLLFDRYYPRVLSYCLRRLGDRPAAEDVTSEVFLSVAGHMRAFGGRTETDFRRWLFRIATNAVRAHLRQTLRRRAIWQKAAESGQLGSSIADEGDAVGASAADASAADWNEVAAAIASLDERQQTIVALRFFAGLSHDEIAGVVDSTPGAVRTALSRALARLREQLAAADEQPATGKPRAVDERSDR